MWVATLLLAHHFILGADLGSMPSGPTLAQADIPVVNTQGDADQTQSAQSTMQPAVAHSIPDPRNEPAVSVGEGMAPVPRKLAEKNMEMGVCGDERDGGRKLVTEIGRTWHWAGSGESSQAPGD